MMVRKGFSLVEIVIVFAIIGVLAAAAIGGLRYLDKVKLSTTNSKLAALDSAIEHYSTTVGEYPTDIRELFEGPSKPALQKRWQEPLVSEDELVDAWKQPFIYVVAPKGSRPPYELYSIGSKGASHINSPRTAQS